MAMLRRAFLPLALTPLLRSEEYRYTSDSTRQPGVPAGKVTKSAWSTARSIPGRRTTTGSMFPLNTIQRQARGRHGLSGRSRIRQRNGTLSCSDRLRQSHSQGRDACYYRCIRQSRNPARAERIGAGALLSKLRVRCGNGPVRTVLIEEILPEVGKSFNLTSDPNLRAISGSSSGGNCSFIVAWHRPDDFRRVVSFIGGFTHQRGALVLPSQVRKFEGKPLRIFLQDGTGDVNIQSNQDMIAALETAGYDAKLVVGSEGHNMKHGGPLLPDALRWVWRDWTNADRQAAEVFCIPICRYLIGVGSSQPRAQIHRRHRQSTRKAMFTSRTSRTIEFTKWIMRTGQVRFLRKIPARPTDSCSDLTAASMPVRMAVAGSSAYDKTGAENPSLPKAPRSNDLAVNAKGEIYFTEPQARRVWFVNAKGEKRIVHEGITFPNGVRLSPDHSLLLVADTATRWVWSFQTQPDGSLAYGVAFHRLEMEDEVDAGQMRSGADGFTVDNEGFLYVCTRLGIQVSDPAGRTSAVLLKPSEKDPIQRGLRGSRSGYALCHRRRSGVPASHEAPGRFPMEDVETAGAAALRCRYASYELHACCLAHGHMRTSMHFTHSGRSPKCAATCGMTPS